MGGVYDEENASRYVAMGARFLLTGSDHSYIVSGAAQRSAFFNRLPGTPAKSLRDAMTAIYLTVMAKAGALAGAGRGTSRAARPDCTAFAERSD